MNKIFKYFMMIAIAIAGLSFASCSDDDDNYTVGEASDGAYLYSDFSSKTFLPDDNQTFTINVGRTNTTGEQSFELKAMTEKTGLAEGFMPLPAKNGRKSKEILKYVK